jgi:hypothetical protein
MGVTSVALIRTHWLPIRGALKSHVYKMNRGENRVHVHSIRKRTQSNMTELKERRKAPVPQISPGPVPPTASAAPAPASAVVLYDDDAAEEFRRRLCTEFSSPKLTGVLNQPAAHNTDNVGYIEMVWTFHPYGCTLPLHQVFEFIRRAGPDSHSVVPSFTVARQQSAVLTVRIYKKRLSKGPLFVYASLCAMCLAVVGSVLRTIF